MGIAHKLALALLRGFLVALIVWMLLGLPAGLAMAMLMKAGVIWSDIVAVLWVGISLICGIIQAARTWRRAGRREIENPASAE